MKALCPHCNSATKGLRGDETRCGHCKKPLDGFNEAQRVSMSQLLEDAFERGRRAERARCADVAALYPLDGFCYDTNNQGEILRLRDTISQAIEKEVPVGQSIR